MYEIAVTVDTNDADYNTEITEITEEDLEKIKPLIEAIKNFKPYETQSGPSDNITWRHTHNYPHGEYVPRRDLGEKSTRELYDFSEEIFQIFEDLCPYGEYGFHSIESITVCPANKKTKLL